MKRIIFSIVTIMLIYNYLPAQTDEVPIDQEKQREREVAIEEERLKEFEKLRAVEEASRAEFEAQRAYEEATRMKEMEGHIRAQHKELQKVLTDLQSKEKSTYNKVLHDLYNQWDNLKALEQDNKELAELETKVQAAEIELSMKEREYKRLRSAEEKQKLKGELQKQLEDLFELKVKKRRMEIGSLEEELKKLEDELKNIEKNKETSIKMKLQQMTEGDIFTW